MRTFPFALGLAVFLASGTVGTAKAVEAAPAESADQAYARALLDRIARYPFQHRLSRCEKIAPRLGGGEKAVGLLLGYIKGPRAFQKNYAVIAMSACGKSAKAALVELLKDKYAGQNAALYLGYMGKEAEPHLIAALKSEHKGVRGAAAVALARLGNEEALEPLKAMLTGKDFMLRSRGANGLALLKDKGIPELLKAAKHADPMIRREALNGLGKPDNSGAVEMLVAALEDKDSQVKRQALQSLARIKGKAAFDAIVKLLKHTDGRVRRSAIGALRRREEDFAAEIAPLIGDKDRYVAGEALNVLGRLNKPEAFDALAGALKLENDSLVSDAVNHLARLGDKRALEPLAEIVVAGKPRVCETAAMALARMGAGGRKTLESLKGKGNENTRKALDRALKIAETKAKVTAMIAKVAAAAEKDRPALIASEVKALGGKYMIGSWVWSSMTEPGAKHRVDAARITAYCSGASQLTRVIYASHYSPEIRMAAVIGLGSTAAKPASDALHFALDDEAPEIRAAALASIGELKIKPLARDVKFHLGDKSEAVRSMAKKVLAELGG